MSDPAGPGAAHRRERRHPPTTRRVAVEAVLVCVGAGLLVGVLWRLLAPEIVIEIVDGQPRPSGPLGESQFGADAWFALLAAAAGVLTAVVQLARHRHRPVAVVCSFTVGAVVGSLVAWRFGVLLGPDQIDVPLDQLAEGARRVLPLDLRATGVLLAWPIAGVAALLVLCLLGNDVGWWRSAAPPDSDLSRAGRSGPWSPR